MKIKLSDIVESPKPIRSNRDEMAFAELVASVKKHGVIVPIKVRPTKEGNYEIIYGHRRVEAARKAGLNEVEGIVEGLNDKRMDIQALIENEVREDLPLMDRARAYRRLHDALGVGWDEIGASLGKSARRIEEVAAYVYEPVELTRYLETPPAKRGKPEPSKLGAWQVQEITRALGDDVEAKIAVADKAVREGLTGEQTKKVAQIIAAEKDPEVRQRLVEKPYDSRFWGKVERAVIEEERKPPKPPSGIEWALYPKTKAILDTLRDWDRRVLPTWNHTIEIGKLSPEAVRFFADRLRAFAAKLVEWAEELEERYAPFGRGQS